MFKRGSYNVKKTSEKNKTHEEKKKEKKMELKKKQDIKSLNIQEAPEYYKKSHPKKVTTKKWFENKTYKEGKL